MVIEGEQIIRRRRRAPGAAAATLAAAVQSAFGLYAADTARPQAGAPGAVVPAMTVSVLRPGAADPAPLDLGTILGKRPVLICYFVPGEPLGEEQLRLVQVQAGGAWSGKVEVLAAMRFGAAGGGEVAQRLFKAGLKFPIVLDESFALGAALKATTSPSLSLVDGAGTLRIADARSLRQKVTPEMQLSQAIDAAARGAAVPTVPKLPTYYPANELIGERYPDFDLPQLGTGSRLKLSQRFGKKIVALYFWHPDCKKCKTLMPGVVTGYETYKSLIDLVSVVALKNGDEARNAADAIAAHKMTFPVVEDDDRRVSRLYKVVSTPTMIFIRPDGKVDSVYTSGDVNYLPVFAAKVKSILRATSPPS